MRLVQRIFLMRRRFDKWLLGLGAVAMPIRIVIGPVSLLIFSCVGLYLAIARHRTARLFAGKFYLFALLYAVWSLGLIFYRGEPIIGNRQIGYTLLFSLFAFAGPGMILIHDPLRAFVLGSRLGTVLAFLIAACSFLMEGGRIGVGGNAAVFAFVAALAAIGATIPLRDQPNRFPPKRPGLWSAFTAAIARFLPDGPQYLIFGAVSVAISETRAVLVVMPIFIFVEILVFAAKHSPVRRSAIYIGSSVALAAVVMVGPIGHKIHERFFGMVEYYDTGDSSKWKDKASADIRMTLWSGAVRVIKENPVTGVGSYGKMDAVRAKAGDKAPMLSGYLHVHNAILDELLNNGAIGLILLIGTWAFGLWHILRNASSAGLVRATWYFVVVGISYGVLHNPLLHETTIAALFFFFGALNAATSRRIMQERRKLAVPGTA